MGSSFGSVFEDQNSLICGFRFWKRNYVFVPWFSLDQQTAFFVFKFER